MDQRLKTDKGKPITGCLEEFRLALKAIAEVFDAGGRKGYERGSWAQVELLRYKDAEWRHRLETGLDPETGLPHRYHEIWNMLAQLELTLRSQEEPSNDQLRNAERPVSSKNNDNRRSTDAGSSSPEHAISRNVGEGTGPDAEGGWDRPIRVLCNACQQVLPANGRCNSFKCTEKERHNIDAHQA